MHAKRKVEYLAKPRLDYPFPVRVRGIDAVGKSFRIDTVLETVSAGGLYLRLRRRVELGARLFVVVKFSAISDGQKPAPRVALRGVVLRVESHADGTCGMAVALNRNRFLYA